MIQKLLKQLAGALLLSIGATADGYSQVSISGPSCVVPGITYQYIINGSWNSASSLSACLTGGTFSTGAACVSSSGNVFSMLSVIWKDTAVMRLDIQSSSGNASILPQRTENLNGGNIGEADQVKIYDSLISSYTFHCETAIGGACVPVYHYQWQRSDNEVNWTNINGATDKDLIFTGSVLVNTYFRRVTVESGSATVAYSASALLVKMF